MTTSTDTIEAADPLSWHLLLGHRWLQNLALVNRCAEA
jgi:hypothetical protein